MKTPWPAGLLTAVAAILDSPDLAGTVARHVQARKPGSPSNHSWAQVAARNQSACSPTLREATESLASGLTWPYYF
jgi:hypothetical protein